MCLHHHPYLDKKIRPYRVALASYVGRTSMLARFGKLSGAELLRRRKVATGAYMRAREMGNSWQELIDILNCMAD